MFCGRVSIVVLVFLIIFENIHGEECDDQWINSHMHLCYKQHIHPTFDLSSNANGYFLEGNLLCQFVFSLCIFIIS